jgi:hypothetical protein
MDARRPAPPTVSCRASDPGSPTRSLGHGRIFKSRRKVPVAVGLGATGSKARGKAPVLSVTGRTTLNGTWPAPPSGLTGRGTLADPGPTGRLFQIWRHVPRLGEARISPQRMPLLN